MSSVMDSGMVMASMMIAIAWTAAVVEEFLRTFCMSRILKFGTTTELKMVAVAVSTMLFTCYHLHYGPHDAAVVGVSGLIFGSYYAYRGRALPVVIAHGLYGTRALLVM